MTEIAPVDGPRAARDVVPGQSWAFKEHRTLAEVWGMAAGTELRGTNSAARRRLPNRRPSLTVTVSYGEGREKRLHLTVGLDPESGGVTEIFVNGGREGADMRHLLQDTATIVSVALQHGVPLAALAKSLARIDGQPASAIGTVLETALAQQALLRPASVEGK